MTLTLILLLPFLGSVCAALLPANARNAEAWLAGAVALAATALVASLYPQVAAAGVLRMTLPIRLGCTLIIGGLALVLLTVF